MSPAPVELITQMEDGCCCPGPFLPNEVFVEILRKTTAKDLESCRLVNRKFNNVISSHYKYLSRPQYSVFLYTENGQIFIEHRKVGNRQKDVQLLRQFDWSKWESIEVNSLELSSMINGALNEIQCCSLDLVCRALRNTHQNSICSLSFISLNLDNTYFDALQNLFNTALDNCKELLFRDCVLPTSLSPKLINGLALFNHYRWIDCKTQDNVNSSDSVLRKFTSDMKAANTKKTFMAEVNSVTVEVVCDFIETWLTVENAAFFNLSLHECDEFWKTAFLAECQRRNISHYCMEFASKTHTNAHIKVSFVEESNICRIWPIFDVPARTAGQLICFARYFRDF